MNVQYSPDIFGMRDPNGTKSSGSSIECIICLGLGLAVAQQLIFAQNNIRAVPPTFWQWYAVPELGSVKHNCQHKVQELVKRGATAFHAS